MRLAYRAALAVELVVRARPCVAQAARATALEHVLPGRAGQQVRTVGSYIAQRTAGSLRRRFFHACSSARVEGVLPAAELALGAVSVVAARHTHARQAMAALAAQQAFAALAAHVL